MKFNFLVLNKLCTRCQQYKPLSDFYNNKAMKDGKSNYCKVCQNEATKKWRQNNPGRAREIERKNKRAERERKGKEHFREYDRQWYAKNADKKKEYVAECRKNEKKKIKARNKLNKAVQSGKIIRPDVCPVCGEETKVDGHHYDYDKPYDVIWACRSCHMKEHSDYIDIDLL